MVSKLKQIGTALTKQFTVKPQHCTAIVRRRQQYCRSIIARFQSGEFLYSCCGLAVAILLRNSLQLKCVQKKLWIVPESYLLCALLYHEIITEIHLIWECNHAEQILRYLYTRDDGKWQALREV